MPEVTPAVPSRPRRHPDSAFRSVADEGGLVVLAGRAEVKVLNPAAIRIFGLLDGTRTVEEIAAVIADEFDVAPESAVADARDFVNDLARHGMLDERSAEVGS
jgi:hypothetical protein